jgi:hypothetical protein
MNVTKKKAKESYRRIKSFVLKWRYIFLLMLIITLSLAAWELHSLSAYRSGLTAASIAQGEGNFQQAQEKLEEVKAVTRKSLVLFIARTDSVEQRIETNNGWIEASEEPKDSVSNNQDITETLEENEPKESEEQYEDTSDSWYPPNEDLNSYDTPNLNKEPSETPSSDINTPEPSSNTSNNDTESTPKTITRTYLCTDQEITEMQDRRYQIVDELGEVELARLNDRKECHDTMQEKWDLCVEQSCQVRMEVYWICIEETCGQYDPENCNDIYDSPFHEYNMTLSSLNQELSSLNGKLEICWDDRLR